MSDPISRPDGAAGSPSRPTADAPGPSPATARAIIARGVAGLVLALLAGVAVLGLILYLASPSADQSTPPSNVAAAPMVSEPPGNPEVSDRMRQIQRTVDDQNRQDAIVTGGSHVAIPLEEAIPIKPAAPPTNIADTPKLAVVEPAPIRIPPQPAAAYGGQGAAPQGPTRADLMADAMRKYLEAVKYRKSEGGVILEPPSDAGSQRRGAGPVMDPSSASRPEAPLGRVLVEGGRTYYGRLLIEANSDAPARVSAEILQGPVKGGRVIGSQRVIRDAMVISFDKLEFGGGTYAIDAVAVDPATNTVALRDDVDHHYFERIVLPAAAAFVAGLGQAISLPATSVVSTGVSISTQSSRTTLAEKLAGGAGAAANATSQVLQQEAAQTPTTVRNRANLPIGIHFIGTVR